MARRVSNSGPLTFESGALPTALRGPVLMLASIGWATACDVRAACDVLQTNIRIWLKGDIRYTLEAYHIGVGRRGPGGGGAGPQ